MTQPFPILILYLLINHCKETFMQKAKESSAEIHDHFKNETNYLQQNKDIQGSDATTSTLT